MKRSTERRVRVERMPRKKKSPEEEIPNPLRVNEAEFTDVIRKMVNTSPLERKHVEGGSRYRRKKNPHEGPLFPPTSKH